MAITDKAKSALTTDHKIIKKWVEEREGKPATVTGTKNRGQVGLLRIKFQDTQTNLEEISWEDFFDKFDKNHLRFLYQEKTKTGELSRFFKFVSGR